MKEGTIYLVLLFPNPWPPIKNIVFIEKKENNLILQIMAYTDGHLSFSLKDQDKIIIDQHYQRITFNHPGRAIVCIIWTANHSEISLNGDKLESHDKTTKVFTLRQKENIENPQSDFNILLPHSIKDYHERFFTETVIDLMTKLRNNKDYDIIKGSGLLRNLLLDEEPLIYKINKKYKLKLEFTVLNYRMKVPIEEGMELQIQNINPEFFPGAKIIDISLKELLSIPCIIYNKYEITIKELIRYCAHVKGGIHTGIPKDSSDKTLKNIDDIFKTVERETSILLLKGIINVALNGIKPLLNEIENANKSSDNLSI